MSRGQALKARARTSGRQPWPFVVSLVAQAFRRCPRGSRPESELAPHFVKVQAPVVALTHARVIDGTGAPPRENQTLVIRDGNIAARGRRGTRSRRRPAPRSSTSPARASSPAS